jgi:lysozyme
MKVTEISDRGLSLIKQFEGLSLKAYLCPAGIWTIGYGATFYQNGQRVKQGDVINQETANLLLKFHVSTFEKSVDSLTNDNITQTQFDALVSFCYNVGISNFRASTLLKKINKNTLDESIKSEFKKWVFADGKKIKGLEYRRDAEANLYFSK